MLKARKENGFDGKKLPRLRLRQRRHLHHREDPPARRQSGRLLRLQRLHLSTRRASTSSLIKQLKEVERRRIKDYVEYHKHAKYHRQAATSGTSPAEVAMPSATQNEINGKDAATLVKNGCIAVGEGRQHADHAGRRQGLPGRRRRLRPGQGGQCRRRGHLRARNAAERQPRFLDLRVHREKLDEIMDNIYKLCYETAEEYGAPGNYVVGANIAGFIKVARAMVAQGLV